MNQSRENKVIKKGYVFLFLLFLIIMKIIFHGFKCRNWGQLFFDNNDVFIWQSITAITASISIIGVFLTYFQNRGKNRADLISKSRIKWLEEARKLTADIHSAASEASTAALTFRGHKYIELMAQKEVKKNGPMAAYAKSGFQNLKNIFDDQLHKLNINKFKLEEKTILFKLFFGKNFENEALLNVVSEINENIKLLANNTNKLQYAFPNEQQMDQYKAIEEKLVEKGKTLRESFIDLCQEYYKKEWEKAKSGK